MTSILYAKSIIYNNYTKEKLDSKSTIMKTLPDIIRNKESGVFYYTYGKYKSLEDAIKAQKDLENRGITNTVIEKKLK